MYNIIVIGGGGHAKVIISILKKIKNFKILGYTDYKDNGEILSIPYLGNDDLINTYIHIRNIGQRKYSPIFPEIVG